MKTLQVKNGDLVLDSGGRPVFITGSTKLVQDLSLWLNEEYGVGYTTPNFGSTLNELIGGGITQGSIAQVQSEISRVLELYRSQQIQDLLEAQQLQQLGNWNKSELIQSIGPIQVTPGYGFLQVTVALTTLNSAMIDLNLLLTPNGIQVQNGQY